MARTAEFETRFRIGANFTGGPAFNKANAAIDRTERNVKGLGATMQRARTHFFNFGKIAAGTFAGFTAAGVLGAAVRGIKDLGIAAFKAADEVVRLRESNKQLLMSYGMTSKEAAVVEKNIYGIAQAMEAAKGGGHDAEIMAKALAGMRKSLSEEEIKAHATALGGYLTKIAGVTPTLESAQKAYDDVNKAIMRGKGPMLEALGWDKAAIKAYQKLDTATRKRVVLMRMEKLFGHLTSEAFATDTGKMAYAMTLFGNLLEDTGDEAVKQKGAIADTLISIAGQLKPIALEVGKIAGAKLKEWLAGVNEKLPEYLENARIWYERLSPIVTALQNIGKAWWEAVSAPLIEALGTAIDKMWAMGPAVEHATNMLQINFKNGLEAAKKGMGEFADYFKGKWDLMPDWVKTACDKMVAVFQAALEKMKPINDWLWNSFNQVPPEAAIPRAMEPYTGSTPTGMGAEKPSTGYAPYGRERGGGGAPLEGMRPSASLAEERAALIAGMDPATQAKLQRVAEAEVGTSNPQRTQAFYETVFNRSASRNQTIARTLNPDYYAVLHGGRSGQRPTNVAAHESALAGIKAGSNVSNYATGNWSGRSGGGLGGPGGYNTLKAGGEQFSVQHADVGWASRKKKASLGETTSALNRSRGAAAPSTALTMNSPITINGVPTDRQGAVGREVEHALQNSGQRLATLKSDRDEERRLTYAFA